MTFFNTTNMRGPDLQAAIQTAKGQDAKVLACFEQGGDWSPSQVKAALDLTKESMLLTSVRRSISDLTKAGALVATGYTIPGPYGRHENTWSKVR